MLRREGVCSSYSLTICSPLLARAGDDLARARTRTRHLAIPGATPPIGDMWCFYSRQAAFDRGISLNPPASTETRSKTVRHTLILIALKEAGGDIDKLH